jgi:H+/Cl- antiporter ClcA
MRYRDLFPAILSSTLAVLTADAMGMPRAFEVAGTALPPPLTMLPAIVVASLIASLFGRGFELYYDGVSRLFRRDVPRLIVPRALLAVSLAVIPAWFLHTGLLGSGYPMIRDLLHDPGLVFGSDRGGVVLVGLCFLFAAVKGAANGLFVGGGLSAGFIMPLATSGTLIGTGVAVLLGVAGSSSGLHALQAAGLAAVLASAMNVPIAAAVTVTEVFGPQMGYPAALAAVMGFQISRHHTVYDVILEDAAPDRSGT